MPSRSPRKIPKITRSRSSKPQYNAFYWYVLAASALVLSGRHLHGTFWQPVRWYLLAASRLVLCARRFTVGDTPTKAERFQRRLFTITCRFLSIQSFSADWQIKSKCRSGARGRCTQILTRSRCACAAASGLPLHRILMHSLLPAIPRENSCEPMYINRKRQVNHEKRTPNDSRSKIYMPRCERQGDRPST